MIIAWIITGSIGILTARHYKTQWLGSKWCGFDIWFAVCMYGDQIFSGGVERRGSLGGGGQISTSSRLPVSRKLAVIAGVIC